MYLLEHEGRKLLLDCACSRANAMKTYQVNLNFPFKPAEIDAMILSHAHIDHSGNIPNLCARDTKAGFTPPTRAWTWRISCCGTAGISSESDVSTSTKNAGKKACPRWNRSIPNGCH
jgi:Cft2 family RNA processing exonuclease